MKNINNILLNSPLNTLKTSYIKVHHGKSHFRNNIKNMWREMLGINIPINRKINLCHHVSSIVNYL